jgi:hypothetical protein
VNPYRAGLHGIARLMESKAAERKDKTLFELSQYLTDVAYRHQPAAQDEQECVTCSTHGPCTDYNNAYRLAVTWLMDEVES